MSSSFLYRGLLGVAMALSAVAGLRWRTALPHVVPSAATSAASPVLVPIVADSDLADAASLVVENDPFRLANAPARVAYDPRVDGVQASSRTLSPARVRPLFVLRAIVGGPPWQAVIDGIPAQPSGSIVRAGATFDRLVVRSVTRDSVVIQGPDTTWVLGFGRRQ